MVKHLGAVQPSIRAPRHSAVTALSFNKQGMRRQADDIVGQTLRRLAGDKLYGD